MEKCMCFITLKVTFLSRDQIKYLEVIRHLHFPRYSKTDTNNSVYSFKTDSNKIFHGFPAFWRNGYRSPRDSLCWRKHHQTESKQGRNTLDWSNWVSNFYNCIPLDNKLLVITIDDIQVITKHRHLTILYLYILFAMLQKSTPPSKFLSTLSTGYFFYLILSHISMNKIIPSL